MTEPTIAFIDVNGEAFAEVAGLLQQRGFSIVGNGSFPDHVSGAAAWDDFEPEGAQAIINRELPAFAEGISRVLQTPAGQAALTDHTGTFVGRTGTRFFQDLINFRATQIRTIETLENLAATRDVRAIALACDNSHVQRTIVLHARKLGIPTVQLAHGIYGSMEHLSYAANMDTVYADSVAAYGDRAEEHLLYLGNAPEKVRKTGAPRWDRLTADPEGQTRAAARRSLGLGENERVVLFTFSYAEAGSAFFRMMSERLIEVHHAVARAMNEIGPGVRFLLRPHPTEVNRSGASSRMREIVSQAYLAWMARLSGMKVELSSGDLETGIRAADVVVCTGSSSVLGETVHLARPAVNIPLIPGERPTYIEDDGIVFAEDAEIGTKILELLHDDTLRAATVEKQLAARPVLNAGHDGSARERVAAFLAELAGAGCEAGHADLEGLIAGGNLNGALGLLDRLIDSQPEEGRARAELLNDRGVVRHHAGRFQEALDDLTVALRLNPLEPCVLDNIQELLADEQARAHLRTGAR